MSRAFALFDRGCLCADLGWRFTTLRGLAYGFGISSGSLQSLPAPCAITRRCLLGCAAAYFDDELSVEFLKDATMLLNVACSLCLL